ncbi:hypothetical protein BU24DRAFT_474556 [Aaosphaeria arxii CBS 175.79]|uniref:Uncharacterized protein n=1 Tax=Aaosphaeria arxii CBS 175.79 TaxID=1450172 RepID=A0A6A5X851_9PLEO|nr:uncharacterized protein BU24DRAFT_474556 [Aaosphaeria arxii CBS 175.79]KAF2009091.1 hypothetical protein BU24DRAFT_474556 [Aaosphaeria arxii CBS 175.79]
MAVSKPSNKKATKQDTPMDSDRKPKTTLNGFSFPKSQTQKVVSSGRRKPTPASSGGYVPKRKAVDVPARTPHSRAAKSRKKSKSDPDSVYYNDTTIFSDLLASDPPSAAVEPPSSPPTVNGRSSQPHSSLPNGRPWQKPQTLVDLESKSASSPPDVSLPPAIFVSDKAFLASMDRDIHLLAAQLSTQPTIQMELPDIYTSDNTPAPWTSTTLFHLYILAYALSLPNICDLIADTWIQQFHAIDDVKALRIWRRNRDVEEDPRLKGVVEFVGNGETFVDTRAMEFNPVRIGELYGNTGRECGARMVWADALALCGADAEEVLEVGGRRDGEVASTTAEAVVEGYKGGGVGWENVDRGEVVRAMEDWPKEFVQDVLRTSLRLTRVRRTLKIEERHPYAWCRRYHEHAKRGLPCYRYLAWQEKDDDHGAEEEEEEEEEEESEDEGQLGESHVALGRLDSVELEDEGMSEDNLDLEVPHTARGKRNVHFAV